MDNAKIAELLRATIDPNQRLQAEEQLNQVTRQRWNFFCHFFLSGVEPNHVLCRELIFGRTSTQPCARWWVRVVPPKPVPILALWVLGGDIQVGQREARLGLIILLRFLAIFRPFSSAHSLRSLAESVAVVVLVRWATA
uniref:(northern house mosquito) hypothetical protein n=1 Tax=Culex pipiens TaxID=7175 RepID=A0A8D8DDA4_CULPI